MKKIKHDHKGTKLLKLGIFASMMLAPFLAVLFKCAYVTFNKNAYQSYSGLQDSETQYTQIDDKNNLITGNQYVLTNAIGSEVASNTGNTQRIYFTVENVTNYNGTYNLASATSVGFYSANANVLYYYFYDSNNNLIGSNPLTNNTNFNITIQYISNNLNNDNNVLSKIPTLFSVSYNNNNSLDNAFYYAVDEMKNNELFNWTTNTTLYTPTAAMTNGMGITTNTIPILITYWLYLTAIYIVIDIVVELFTALTHMITSRFEQ